MFVYVFVLSKKYLRGIESRTAAADAISNRKTASHKFSFDFRSLCTHKSIHLFVTNTFVHVHRGKREQKNGTV